MTYFPDLAPCTYLDRETADKLVAVGGVDRKLAANAPHAYIVAARAQLARRAQAVLQ